MHPGTRGPRGAAERALSRDRLTEHNAAAGVTAGGVARRLEAGCCAAGPGTTIRTTRARCTGETPCLPSVAQRLQQWPAPARTSCAVARRTAKVHWTFGSSSPRTTATTTSGLGCCVRPTSFWSFPGEVPCGAERVAGVRRGSLPPPELSADHGWRAEARRGRWRGSVPSARLGSSAPSGAYQTGAPAGLAPPAPRPHTRALLESAWQPNSPKTVGSAVRTNPPGPTHS